MCRCSSRIRRSPSVTPVDGNFRGAGNDTPGTAVQTRGVTEGTYEPAQRSHQKGRRFYVTARLATTVRRFHSRPFASIAQNGFAEALVDAIRDPDVRRLAERPLIGSIDLISDNTDFGETPTWRASLRRLYDW